MPETQLYPLPVREEHGPDYDYTATYEVLSVLSPNAGPCQTCDKPMVRLLAKQHVNHNGYQYTHTFDFLYAHADGSEPHDGKITGCVKPKCPQCGKYGSLVFQMQAYGDVTDCTACGYNHWYDIGD